jgi:hypothetical protein
MQPNTFTRRECKGKVYVQNTGKNSCRIRNQLKSRIRIRTRKISFRINNSARNITNLSYTFYTFTFRWQNSFKIYYLACKHVILAKYFFCSQLYLVEYICTPNLQYKLCASIGTNVFKICYTGYSVLLLFFSVAPLCKILTHI